MAFSSEFNRGINIIDIDCTWILFKSGLSRKIERCLKL
jgi:hypothetical protein